MKSIGPWRVAVAGLASVQVAGAALLALVVVATALAPLVTSNGPGRQFRDRAYAPPMRVRVWDGARFRMPFVYPLVLEDRLLRTYAADRSRPVPIRWFEDGSLMSVEGTHGPLLLLGADTLGRDLLARLLAGARLSLGVTALGVAGALMIGVLVGGLAGALGGRADGLLMAAADFVLVLPATYLVLVLRGVLPLVLSTGQVFGLMAALFAVAAWPHVARGVRAIVATERQRDYAEASRAAGAGTFRLLGQLLPAAKGFVAVETLLLVPALLVAEATVSYLGLGFAEPQASWGTMLQDAANVRIMSEAPWMLAPAGVMFVVVLGVQLVGRARAPHTVLLLGERTV